MLWLRVRQTLRITSLIVVLHLGIWITLLILYPGSEKLQAMVFWNRRLRKVLGAFYIDWLIIWVPFIRARLMTHLSNGLQKMHACRFFGMSPVSSRTSIFADRWWNSEIG